MSAAKIISVHRFIYVKAFIGYDQPRFTVAPKFFSAPIESLDRKWQIAEGNLVGFDKQTWSKEAIRLWFVDLSHPRVKHLPAMTSMFPIRANGLYQIATHLSGNGADDENSLIILGLDYITEAGFTSCQRMIKQYTMADSKTDLTGVYSFMQIQLRQTGRRINVCRIA
jgi:hypothetical protein